MSAYVVGLTGGIGSGKTTVTQLFVELGATVVDTDAIAHALTGPSGEAMPAVRAAFGSEVIRPDGALDRTVMRQLVFKEPALRKTLESILHPLIRRDSTEACLAAETPYAILAIPLLVESGNWQERCDRVLVVDCSEALQVSRVMARNAMLEDEVKSILAAQASRAERLKVANDIILNDGDLLSLQSKVGELHKTYLQQAQKKLQANH